LRTFYTQEKEKYECLIPALETPKEEEKTNQPELCKYLLSTRFDLRLEINDRNEYFL